MKNHENRKYFLDKRKPAETGLEMAHMLKPLGKDFKAMCVNFLT